MDDLKNKIVKKLKSKGFEDHRYPVTRRDLIKLGLLAGGGAIVQTTFLQQAFAQTIGTPTIPFLVFDLSGGASMPGNFLAGKEGGPEDLCDSYRFHGWNPRANDSLDRTFGLPMAKKESRMLAGMRENLPAAIKNSETQNMVKMGSFCHFTLNDTPTNRISALTMASRVGLRGSYVKNGISLMGTLSGGNSDVFLADSRFRPKTVTSVADVMSMTSFGEKYESLNAETRRNIFKLLKDSASDLPVLRDLYQEMAGGGLSEPKLDPRRSVVNSVYGLRPESEGVDALHAAIVYNVLQGHCGPGVLTFSGCDYHDNTQATGDTKDFEIGRAIGRAIHSAYLLKKPLFFQIITDGGVTAPGSDNYERRWVADQNLHSMSVIGYFDPNRPVETRRSQVGHYNAGAQVELETFIGNKPDVMVNGTMANYLALNGLLGDFDKLTGTRANARDIEESLIFK